MLIHGATIGNAVSYEPVGTEPIKLRAGEAIAAGGFLHPHATAAQRGRVGTDTAVATTKVYFAQALTAAAAAGDVFEAKPIRW